VLTIGALTLVPTFAAGQVLYTTATTNATDVITATTTLAGATVTILNGETPVISGNAATWSAGENNVTITVTEPGVGGEVGIYRVDVTKS
jgi:hypothetical protein